MTRVLVWLAVGAAASAWTATVWLALVFLPPPAQGGFLAAAALLAVALVSCSGIAAYALARRQVAPLREIVRLLDAGRFDAMDQVAPARPGGEVNALLAGLRRTRERLRATAEQQEQDRAQLATILEHMADGVLVVDADDRVELSNRAALHLLRQRASVGRRLVEVAQDADVVEVIRAARSTGTVSQVLELRQQSGAPRRWVQVVATRLPPDRRLLVLLQDVTEMRRAEAARRDFVANISHELRTPVAALKALVETLEAGALEDPREGREFLRRMHVEVDGLAQMVSELLQLARLEAGRLDLELGEADARELVHGAVERIRPYAERVGLRVAEAVAESADLSVRADGRRISQVLANLLANAIKFTPPGGRIEVGARPADGEVELWVSDTGIGIRPGNLARVFERFYKADMSRSGEGTGLGLAICKHVVQAHGGRIWAESEGEGRGATFRFRLPASEAHVSSEDATHPSSAPAAARPV